MAVDWKALADKFQPLVRGQGGLLLLGVSVLGIGLIMGLAAGRISGSGVQAVPPSSSLPVLPSAEQVVAAPHPVVMLPNDPPATETSAHTVVEEPPHPVKAEAVAAPTQVAMTLPPTPPSSSGRQDWLTYALPSPDTVGKPMIAVIIDDMGVDKRRSERMLQLPGPVTMSFMSYADNLAHQTEEARARGYELMMHLPMEPLGESIDPGPGALLSSLSLDEVRRRMVDDLGKFSGYVGINNHMGSKFTANAPGMQVVMEELHRRGLLFIDSLTTDRSVGLALAHRAGVPTAGRNVFLDNQGDLAAVNAQLEKTEELARKHGNVIAIGHPRDATIAALAAWLPTLERKGFVLVPVTAVVKARMTSPPTQLVNGER